MGFGTKRESLDALGFLTGLFFFGFFLGFLSVLRGELFKGGGPKIGCLGLGGGGGGAEPHKGNFSLFKFLNVNAKG